MYRLALETAIYGDVMVFCDELSFWWLKLLGILVMGFGDFMVEF